MANKKTKQEEPIQEKKSSKVKSKIDPEKLKLAKEVNASIEKDFGKGTVMSLGDKVNYEGEVVSTGSFSLDLALGVGGIPRGRIVEIYGPESSGKTTLAMHIIREVQRAGGLAAIVDAEHAFDKEYAAKLGLNVDELTFNQPDYAEQGLQIADRWISSGAYDVILIDSVAALVPKGELDGQIGDSKMGLMARLMSQTLRKITGIANNNNCIVIFINQLRDKIGVMFGSPETTTGGNALKFYASIRLDVRRGKNIGTEDDIYGNKVTIKVKKNKVAPPFKKAEIDLIYGEGFDVVAEILDEAIKAAIVKQAGSWFSYNDDKLGQGRETVLGIFKDNPDLCEEVKQKVLNFKNNTN